LGKVLKIKKSSSYFSSLGYFFHGLGFALNWTTNGLGYILGDFVTNPSGHPEASF
jgi:hypothetical protein